MLHIPRGVGVVAKFGLTIAIAFATGYNLMVAQPDCQKSCGCGVYDGVSGTRTGSAQCSPQMGGLCYYRECAGTIRCSQRGNNKRAAVGRGAVAKFFATRIARIGSTMHANPWQSYVVAITSNVPSVLIHRLFA